MRKPKKPLNGSRNATAEMMEGLVLANDGRFHMLARPGALVRSDIPQRKVALFIGGGSGH